MFVVLRKNSLYLVVSLLLPVRWGKLVDEQQSGLVV